MSSTTSIEWTDKTWNPTTGCSKVSPGCKHCYAERVFPRPYPGRAFTDVQCHEDRLDQPLHWRKPAMVFVDSMSDLFHEAVPDEFIDRVFAVMALCPQHKFQILTKRPARMRTYCENSEQQNTPGRIADIIIKRRRESGDPVLTGPLAHLDPGAIWYPLANVWLGVSVEDQKTADERIPLLLLTPAAVRFVSYEPALGPVNLLNAQCGYDRHGYRKPLLTNDKLNWVICGGESGPGARPMHPDWARSVRDQCQAAGVPFFFKQWGEWDVVARGDCEHPSSDGAQGPVRALVPPTVDIWKCTRCGRLHGIDRSRQAFDFGCLGKRHTGRLLDGREWNEYPTPGDAR